MRRMVPPASVIAAVHGGLTMDRAPMVNRCVWNDLIAHKVLLHRLKNSNKQKNNATG